MHFDNLRTVLAGPEIRLVRDLEFVFEQIDHMNNQNRWREAEARNLSHIWQPNADPPRK